jgi:hypothetical protein
MVHMTKKKQLAVSNRLLGNGVELGLQAAAAVLGQRSTAAA